MVLVAHPSVPARSVKALIALAKQQPGQLNFASTGPGDTNHLAAELFQIRAGVQMVHVPYKGAAPATLSVVMGETGLMFSNIVPVMPPLQAGKVVPIGISSLTRSPMVPDVRPIAEQGLPGFEVENLYALLAPHGTPTDIVRRLSEELRRAVQSPELKERLQADGSRVITGSPDELEKTIVTEIAKWSKVIKTAGIKAEY
jgi:tripartite-type tricarboxylate transporter receptor subunit TctC